jgi:hypothetical protein
MLALALALVLHDAPTAAKADVLARAKDWDTLYLAFGADPPKEMPAPERQRIGATLTKGCEANLPGDAMMAGSLGDRAVAWFESADALLCSALAAKKTDQRGAAEATLRQGTQRFPKHPSLLLELGRFLLEDHDAVGATVALEQVPKKSKEAAEARSLLAEAKAMDTPAPAEPVAVAPGAPGDDAPAPRGPLQAGPPGKPTGSLTYESLVDGEGRRVRQNTHFRFRYFNGQRDFGQRADYEGRVQAALELARSEAQRILGVARDSAIDVILYSREEFQLHHGQAFANAVAGFYSASAIRMNDSVDINPRVQATLVHEYVHAVVDELTGFNDRALPIWVNEGLAEYTEWRHLGSDGAPLGQRKGLESLAAAGQLPPLEQLSHGALIATANPALSYALAASAVRLLVATRGMPEVLALIRDVGHGAPFEQVLEQRFGKSLTRLDEELRDDLKPR